MNPRRCWRNTPEARGESPKEARQHGGGAGLGVGRHGGRTGWPHLIASRPPICSCVF
jgi:hypothetical protein